MRLVSEDFTCLKHPTVLNAILLDALFAKALFIVVNADPDTFYQELPLQATCTKCANQCGTCFDSANNCETCAPGFSKKGWACVNNNNIKLTLVLAGNFTDLTTDQYVNIEEGICDYIGKDKSQVTIDQLKSGSILIDTTINVDNTAQQSTLASSLQSGLTTGSIIAGFMIESTAISSNTVDIAKDDSEI